jgi:branched-chain amino acid transport system ATP-binding protein
MPEAALLSVADLNAWYGESHILQGAQFEVRRGEVVTLLGRNGVGKTTTLKAGCHSIRFSASSRT